MYLPFPLTKRPGIGERERERGRGTERENNAWKKKK